MARRGGALLAVMWLSAALAAIAFSVANTVRGETERTSTAVDSLRVRYLAAGSVDRAALSMRAGPPFYETGSARIDFSYAAGDVAVEIIPENAKFNINHIQPQELNRLLLNVGVSPERANELTMAIVDWRTINPNALTIFDQYYLSLTPSFRAPHASIEETEELLLVKGMTPDLFYGTWTRDSQGRLIPIAGLRDCVSPYGSLSGPFDVNGAAAPVLATIGIDPGAVAAIIERRRATPFRNLQELAAFGLGGGRLTVGGYAMYTIRATARLRTPAGAPSDLRRTVSALIRFRKIGTTPPYDVLRWYEN